MMFAPDRHVMAVVVVAAIGLAASAALEAMDVHVASDKAFEFKGVRTWAWNPDGRGDVIMARSPDDDPEAMQKRAEPVIVDAVTTEMGRRGLQAASGQPDLFVTYYLLLSINAATQTLGQFLPGTTAWGLPPFAPATQSMTMMNSGSLVLDLSANGKVVWRGVAQAQLKMDADDKKRESVIREAVRDLLKRYPPKK
jgi:Domain of unknown function (DUF4136)